MSDICETFLGPSNLSVRFPLCILEKVLLSYSIVYPVLQEKAKTKHTINTTKMMLYTICIPLYITFYEQNHCAMTAYWIACLLLMQ